MPGIKGSSLCILIDGKQHRVGEVLKARTGKPIDGALVVTFRFKPDWVELLKLMATTSSR